MSIQRLFDHVFWADARVLDRLRAGDAGAVRVGLFSHLLTAEQVWLARIRGEDSSQIAIWPNLTIQECSTLATELREGYRAVLADSWPGGTDRLVTYRNSTGREFSSSVGDILMHVALHGSYHRGQIAARMRDEGIDPINSDFITFVREGSPPIHLTDGDTGDERTACGDFFLCRSRDGTNMADWVAREAYSHEVHSVGFWPEPASTTSTSPTS
ncbi:MAG: hypothetical protein H0U67_02080 [Gemmatimonadetes bacterium]|nr:hypothetical protein [Gemmatimonadota bacterium]